MEAERWSRKRSLGLSGLDCYLLESVARQQWRANGCLLCRRCRPGPQLDAHRFPPGMLCDVDCGWSHHVEDEESQYDPFCGRGAALAG